VQCAEKKTRCTVIWADEHRPGQEKSSGCEVARRSGVSVKNYLPLEGATVTIAPSNAAWHRHRFRFPWNCATNASGAGTRISATDVSGNGCTSRPCCLYRSELCLRVDFWLESEHINITAVVRTCDPGVG